MKTGAATAALSAPLPLLVRDLAALLRWRLALGNTLAALAGALLTPAPLPAAKLLAALAGVTLLAAAASALNQWQERDLDARMERTRQRPLVAGRLTDVALPLAATLAACGLLLLAACGPWPALLGLAALLCYNGLYTPLKRSSTAALPIGALCGALPPLIGWCAAGGTLADPHGWLLAGLLLLWQPPHVWLLSLRYAADYRRAGLPTLATHFGAGPLLALCRLWTGALLAGALLLPALGLLAPPLAWGYLALLALLAPLPAWDATLCRRLQLFPPLLAAALLLQRLLY